MKTYHDMLRYVLENGTVKNDRTGVGTISVFSHQVKFNLQEGFPLLTTKKVFWKGVVEELLWFLRGETNIRSLQEKGVKIWDAWADENGDLGPVYGSQWRSWEYLTALFSHDKPTEVFGHTIDQIENLVEEIKTNPDSRRMIVSAWNPVDVPKMKLPPCHAFWQCNVTDGKLSLQLYQRSADLFLGVSFNIASYALLTHMLAHVTGLQVGTFSHVFGDLHIYRNHLEAVKEQLSREPRPLPTLQINPAVKTIDDFKLEDFTLVGYDPHPAIKAEVAV